MQTHTKEVLLIIFVMVFAEVEGKGTEILCRYMIKIMEKAAKRKLVNNHLKAS